MIQVGLSTDCVSLEHEEKGTSEGDSSILYETTAVLLHMGEAVSLTVFSNDLLLALLDRVPSLATKLLDLQKLCADSVADCGLLGCSYGTTAWAL